MFDPTECLVYCYYFHDMQKIRSKNKRSDPPPAQNHPSAKVLRDRDER